MCVEKSSLEPMKKIFNGTLKTVNMEKVADDCYMLVLKGKRHDYRK